MKKYKYIQTFVKNEDGVETIEFIGLVAVAAVLIGVIASLGKKMKDEVGLANDQLSSEMTKLKEDLGN